MAPMMWEDFETDLDTVSPQSMVTLLHPRSGILSHVRDLTIHGTKKGEDWLKLVIAAIPRDRVRGFYTFINLDTLTWYLLLLSQRNIQWMWDSPWSTSPGYFGSSDLDSGEHHKSIGSLLPEVSFVRLDVQANGASIERVFNGIKSVSRCCPKIKSLALIDHGSGPVSGNSETSLSALFNYSKEAPLFFNLTYLQLSCLNIAMPGEQTLCKNLNLSRLLSLQILECSHLVLFLEGLSSFYTDSTGELSKLTITLPYQLERPLETLQAVEKLFRVCPQLKSLQLDLSRHGFVAKDCILAHCQTLITLWISTGQSSLAIHLSAKDMGFILGACNKLNALAMNMPSLGAVASLDAEFVNMLLGSWVQVPEEWVISTPHITLYQALMQNIANQILRFMAKQGSNLKVLSFQPSHEQCMYEDEELVRDGNSHRWPEYHYCRAHATDITGTTVVIANPLRNIKLEFPAMVDFFDYI
ncbi:hypothetical protein IG631_22328 [Alternaria alternata]|nr:hypothetical protein IG631_22328 [Alternaria alternata]